MSEIIFKLIEIAVMLGVLFYVRAIVPHAEQDQWQKIFEEIQTWALIAVHWAQDRLWTEPGTDRRKAAVNALKQIRDQLGLQQALTDDQIYMLISDAYMVMKAEESKKETNVLEPAIGFNYEAEVTSDDNI